MKRNIVVDERVQGLKRKITNEAFQLLMLFLLGSILVKQFVLNTDFSGYSTEFIAFFGASFYILIRNVFVGNKLFINEKRKNNSIIIIVLINGVIVTAVTAITQYFNSESSEGYEITSSIVFFLAYTISLFLMYMTISWVNQRRVKKIEEQYEDDDEV